MNSWLHCINCSLQHSPLDGVNHLIRIFFFSFRTIFLLLHSLFHFRNSFRWFSSRRLAFVEAPRVFHFWSRSSTGFFNRFREESRSTYFGRQREQQSHHFCEKRGTTEMRNFDLIRINTVRRVFIPKTTVPWLGVVNYNFHLY